METSQKTLLLHDDAEALMLMERIKKMKVAEQNRGDGLLEEDERERSKARDICSHQTWAEAS